jgi:hypothetical protein
VTAAAVTVLFCKRTKMRANVRGGRYAGYPVALAKSD